MRIQQSFTALVLTAGALIHAEYNAGLGVGGPLLPHVNLPRAPKRAAQDKKGVFLMNRIAPATTEIYVANADGSNEQLLLGNNSVWDYHAAWSPDGQWVTFSTSRNGDGQSDIYRVRTNGSDLQPVAATPSFEDKLVLSPDGTKGAYVSTANGYTANIWVIDFTTGESYNLTDTALTRTNVSADLSPRGHFSPSWSPDGQWITFSSDRNTAWTGHGNGSGWEHTQALSIYAIHPDGTGFRQVITNGSEFSCEFPLVSFFFFKKKKSEEPVSNLWRHVITVGTPKFSPDGKRIVFFQLSREDTYNAHSSFASGITSWIASVDFETGGDYQVHITQPKLMTNPQYIGNSSTIGYLVKDINSPGINYTSVG